MKTKRYSPSRGKQDEILRSQDYCCFYCYRAFDSYTKLAGEEKLVRVHWDHQIPLTYSQSNANVEFVASCQFCNLWKGATVFETVEQARDYLRKKWAEGIRYSKDCAECGTAFEVRRHWQQYCSQKCQYKAWSRIHRPPIKQSNAA